MTLKSCEHKKRLNGDEHILYSVFGEKVRYAPLAHVSPSLNPYIEPECNPGQFSKQNDFISELLTRIEKDYHESGRPLHLADPSLSMIKIMTLEEFNNKSAKELQHLHASNHILVTGYPDPTFGFDKVGLGTLASPSQRFTIHGSSWFLMMSSSLNAHFPADFSIKVEEDENVRHTIGNTAHLLGSHCSPNGKILNALDFPKSNLDHPPTSIASDVFAFRRNSSNQRFFSEYPDLEMRWGLAATKGAFSGFHVDSHGRATYVSCVNKDGSKIWVAVGTKDNAVASFFENVQNSIRFFSKDVPSIDQFPEVKLEAVLLQPGMRLYVFCYPTRTSANASFFLQIYATQYPPRRCNPHVIHLLWGTLPCYLLPPRNLQWIFTDLCAWHPY